MRSRRRRRSAASGEPGLGSRRLEVAVSALREAVRTRARRAHGRRSLDTRACFILRTLLIHEYRRLHLRDPLLPPRLLPGDWPGARAAALCREIYARVFAASEAHLSSVGAQLDGPLPEPDAAVMQRFGGIGATAPAQVSTREEE